MACISCSRSAFRDVITSMSEKISIWWASNRFLQVSLDSIYRFFSGTTRTIYSWSYFAILKAIRMPWFSVVISWQYPLSHFPRHPLCDICSCAMEWNGIVDISSSHITGVRSPHYTWDYNLLQDIPSIVIVSKNHLNPFHIETSPVEPPKI